MQRLLLQQGARHAWRSGESLLSFAKPEGLRQLSTTPITRAEDGSSGGSSWMPKWLQQKLPGVLGGTREYDELEDLTLDSECKLTP